MRAVQTGVEMNQLSQKDLEGLSSRGLYQALQEYADTDFYPYHMPGHKRSPLAGEMAEYYRLDITEIDGFDNLHHAEGILQEAQERAGRLYGAEETHYLVNGSTCGVLASVMAATEQGDEILIARNCHRSVYHAAILQRLTLHYYYPAIIEEYGIYDGVDVHEISRLLDQYPGCKAVVITSPTYEGILSDVEAVAKAVHARGRLLIVDEAHGAHLKEGAVAGGADLVIHSLHKTLPAMTQTALLHVNGERVNRRKLRRLLTMLQTSSPSYVMMASMDCCVRYMEAEGRERLALFQTRYDAFMRRIDVCKHIRVGKMADVACTPDSCGAYEARRAKYALAGWDMGKLVISVKNTPMTGQQLYDMLRDDFHLQMEMAAATYVLAMMTIMDTGEGWERLADAIMQIDDKIEIQKRKEEGMPERNRTEPEATESERAGSGCVKPEGIEAEHEEPERAKPTDTEPEVRMMPAQAFDSLQEEIPLAASAGRVLADFISLYPPGIPLLVPGEVMSEELLLRVQDSRKMGLQVHGITDNGGIMVVC